MTTAVALALIGLGVLLMLGAYRNRNPLDVIRYGLDGRTTVRPIG